MGWRASDPYGKIPRGWIAVFRCAGACEVSVSGVAGRGLECYAFAMAHLHRFFVEPDAVQGDSATLDGAEAHHALHVVRVQHGDTLALFDGVGRELQGRVTATTRHDVTVEVEEERNIQPELRTLTLLQAALHRDKSIEELIRRCTEIGVGRFVFYPSERSEHPPKLSDKWRRWEIGRAHV